MSVFVAEEPDLLNDVRRSSCGKHSTSPSLKGSVRFLPALSGFSGPGVFVVNFPDS